MPSTDASSSALFKAATPDLYRRNAFRLTGLMVTASAREVARQADKLKMLAEVGGNAADQLSVIPGMEAPTADEVREASQRLKDVEARALDEFFWFWPEDWGQPDADEAFMALKRHDLDSAFSIWAQREVETDSFIAVRNVALVLHMRAIEWALLDFDHPLPQDRLEKVHGYWKEAFNRWEWLADDDRLWDAFKARIRQIDDPALTTGFARRLRSELPQAFDKINAELALAYAEKGRRDEARWHVDFLRSTHAGLDDTATTIDDVLAPTRTRLSNAIKSASSKSQNDKASGLKEAGNLITAAEPLLAVMSMLQMPTSTECQELFDDVARTALNCAGLTYKAFTDQSNSAGRPNSANQSPALVAGTQFISILRRLRGVAKDKELIENIGRIIRDVESNLQFERHLKPILELAVKIRDTPGIKAVEKLNRLSSQVLPPLDTLISQKALSAELLDDLCNAISAMLRGLGIDANNNDSMPGVAAQAMNAALRYARDQQLKERLQQDVYAAKNNQQAKFESNRAKSGCCIPLLFAITGIIGGTYALINTIV